MNQPTAASSTSLNHSDRRSFLWKVLDRYDLYIGTTISRAAAVTALNTLAAGYVLLNARSIFVTFGDHTVLLGCARVTIVLVGVAAFLSTLLSFWALTPYLPYPPGKSLIFFEHVAARTQGDFVKEIEAVDQHQVNRDLAEQVHDVATALHKKFRLLRYASCCTIAGLCLLGLFGVVVSVSAIKFWVSP